MLIQLEIIFCDKSYRWLFKPSKWHAYNLNDFQTISLVIWPEMMFQKRTKSLKRLFYELKSNTKYYRNHLKPSIATVTFPRYYLNVFSDSFIGKLTRNQKWGQKTWRYSSKLGTFLRDGGLVNELAASISMHTPTHAEIKNDKSFVVLIKGLRLSGPTYYSSIRWKLKVGRRRHPMMVMMMISTPLSVAFRFIECSS